MPNGRMLNTDTQRAMLKALSAFSHSLDENGKQLILASKIMTDERENDVVSLAYAQRLENCVNDLYKVGEVVESFYNGLCQEIKEIEIILQGLNKNN